MNLLINLIDLKISVVILRINKKNQISKNDLRILAFAICREASKEYFP